MQFKINSKSIMIKLPEWEKAVRHNSHKSDILILNKKNKHTQWQWMRKKMTPHTKFEVENGLTVDSMNDEESE